MHFDALMIDLGNMGRGEEEELGQPWIRENGQPIEYKRCIASANEWPLVLDTIFLFSSINMCNLVSFVALKCDATTPTTVLLSLEIFFFLRLLRVALAVAERSNQINVCASTECVPIIRLCVWRRCRARLLMSKFCTNRKLVILTLTFSIAKSPLNLNTLLSSIMYVSP